MPKSFSRTPEPIQISQNPLKESPELLLRTSANLAQNLTGLRISMERNDPSKILWSGSELVPSRGSPPVEHENVLRLVNDAAQGIVEAIHGEMRLRTKEVDARALGRRALVAMFSMEKPKHLEADALLSMAFDLEAHGLFLAWRSLLRVFMLVERHDGVEQSMVDEATEFAAKAVEMDPMNSMVLAAAANTALIIEGNAEKGKELSKRALRINPANPFALDASAMAAMYHGELANAHRLHDARVHPLVVAARRVPTQDQGRGCQLFPAFPTR